ncbi:MAG TPA: DnaJ family domain-containing protein [Anaerolineales bacterium]|nr:DnaJ family domain-containing protein [Anaerolineales bacterium]
MDNKARGIEEIIQQAMKDGAFDNLSGKGRPLDLEENPHLDPEWQLAYHLLKQNGFAPQFIEQRQAIELALAAARQALARSWTWRQRELERGEDAALVEAEWGRAKKEFQQTVEFLNKKIRTYNLEVPTPSLNRHLIKFAEELSRIGSLGD